MAKKLVLTASINATLAVGAAAEEHLQHSMGLANARRWDPALLGYSVDIAKLMGGA